MFYFLFLQSKLSKLSQATKLEPLNEGSGSALLQMVSVYVVVQFYPWFKFYFSLFWGMVMYDNELKTMGNKT